MRSKFAVRCSIFGLLVFVTLSLSGCLIGTGGPVTEITISPTHDVLFSGETTTFTAVGKSADGKTLTIEPEWTILGGFGALSAKGSSATFQATEWGFEGVVVIQASIGEIQSNPAIITISPLLTDSKVFDVPEPDSIDFTLTSTAPQIVLGEVPLDTYRLERIFEVAMFPYPQYKITATFIENGELITPYLSNAHSLSILRPVDDVNLNRLPEKVYLSRSYYYKLLGQRTVGPNTETKYTRTYTLGTSQTEATEFTWSTTTEYKGKAQWGWAEVSASISTTLETKAAYSSTVMEIVTESNEWRIPATEGQETLVGVWQRIDTFYVSDSEGRPVETSPVFNGHYLDNLSFSIATEDIRSKTWRFPVE